MLTTASRLSMPLGEAIFSLRAMRKLKPDPIPDADIRDILEAAGPKRREHPVLALPGGDGCHLARAAWRAIR